VENVTVNQNWYDYGVSDPTRELSPKTVMKWVFTDFNTLQILLDCG